MAGVEKAGQVTGETITRLQLEEVLQGAHAAGDRALAACASRAIVGDSLYQRALLARCAVAYNARFGARP